MLKNPKIKDEVKTRREAEKSEDIADRAEVLELYTKIMRKQEATDTDKIKAAKELSSMRGYLQEKESDDQEQLEKLVEAINNNVNTNLI